MTTTEETDEKTAKAQKKSRKESADKALRTDAVLAAADEQARAALDGIAEPGTVGTHIGMTMVAERLGMHFFECAAPGYRGWYWGVSVARVPRGKEATVCETNLVPGPQALLAPEWVPYADRLAPGDLRPGDVLPKKDEDPLLEPGFEATGDEDVDQVGFFELGLGRKRVLSAEGREAAATRWYAGEHGPTSQEAVKSSATCGTCGFYLPLAGALRPVFGVCANEWSSSDGSVVSLDHGCGAHSETDAEKPEPIPMSEPVLDELAIDVERTEPREEPAGATDSEQDTASGGAGAGDTEAGDVEEQPSED